MSALINQHQEIDSDKHSVDNLYRTTRLTKQDVRQGKLKVKAIK